MEKANRTAGKGSGDRLGDKLGKSRFSLFRGREEKMGELIAALVVIALILLFVFH